MSDTRPTPETEAFKRTVGVPWHEFASKLERERDEAREAKLGLCGLSTEETWRKVSEANALRAHIDELQTLLPDDATIKQGVERLKRERDAMLEAMTGVYKHLLSIQFNDIFEDTMRVHA